MTGQICPYCGAHDGVYRYERLRDWLGLLVYIGVSGIALLWGSVWGLSRTDPLMSGVKFGTVFVAGSVVFTYLVLASLVLRVYLERFILCEQCHHHWVTETA